MLINIISNSDEYLKESEAVAKEIAEKEKKRLKNVPSPKKELMIENIAYN